MQVLEIVVVENKKSAGIHFETGEKLHWVYVTNDEENGEMK